MKAMAAAAMATKVPVPVGPAHPQLWDGLVGGWGPGGRILTLKEMECLRESRGDSLWKNESSGGRYDVLG